MIGSEREREKHTQEYIIIDKSFYASFSNERFWIARPVQTGFLCQFSQCMYIYVYNYMRLSCFQCKYYIELARTLGKIDKRMKQNGWNKYKTKRPLID